MADIYYFIATLLLCCLDLWWRSGTLAWNWIIPLRCVLNLVRCVMFLREFSVERHSSSARSRELREILVEQIYSTAR